jgi:hypothetical protein
MRSPRVHFSVNSEPSASSVRRQRSTLYSGSNWQLRGLA